ncbi:unnamed protein product [Prunus armeniaca]
MVNLNWPEQKKSKPTTEGSSNRERRVIRETSQRTKVTISVGVVLSSKCKCATELEVVLDRLNQPTPHYSKRKIKQPNKEIPIKIPGNEKPLATIIEGRWYSVRKSGRPTLELTRTQKRRVQRQYCTFLKSQGDTQVPSETSSARNGKNPELEPSQAQGESEPIPIEGQEDWTEEYEEEQLDYEPSADD